jgi:hypothetical protein
MTEQKNQVVSHRVGFKSWEVTQNGRSLLVTNHDTGRTVQFDPPAEWGDKWSWGLMDGGFYFKREEK